MIFYRRRRMVRIAQDILSAVRLTLYTDRANGAVFRDRLARMERSIERDLLDGVFGANLSELIEDAVTDGVSFAPFLSLTSQVFAIETADEVEGQLIASAATVALSGAAQTILATSFKTADDVTGVRSRFAALTDLAEERAATRSLDDVAISIRDLRSALIAFLETSIYRLPRFVSYQINEPVPALVLSTHFYGDGGKADLIADENDVPNPLFMPVTGRVLAIDG